MVEWRNNSNNQPHSPTLTPFPLPVILFDRHTISTPNLLTSPFVKQHAGVLGVEPLVGFMAALLCFHSHRVTIRGVASAVHAGPHRRPAKNLRC